MAQNYYAELYYHFIWRTKGSLPLITSDIQPRLWAELLRKAAELGAYPIEVGGMDDHMHLLIGAPPTVLLSDFSGKLKGSTSHFVNHDLNPARRLHWNEGYGILSLARRNVPAVRAYVRKQAEHHRGNTLNAKMELTPVNGGEMHGDAAPPPAEAGG
jgi:REP element-mobilizing transposase RayT